MFHVPCLFRPSAIMTLHILQYSVALSNIYLFLISPPYSLINIRIFFKYVIHFFLCSLSFSMPFEFPIFLAHSPHYVFLYDSMYKRAICFHFILYFLVVCMFCLWHRQYPSKQPHVYYLKWPLHVGKNFQHSLPYSRKHIM